jgi:hypothetical protein
MKANSLFTLQFLLIFLARSSSFIEMIGMGDLIQGLAIHQPTIDPYGAGSTAIMLDPDITAFLMKFNNRT